MSKIGEFSVSVLIDELLMKENEFFGPNCNLRTVDKEKIKQLKNALSRLQQHIGEITFKANDYEESTIDRNILTQIDKDNNCYSLILGRPTTIVSCYRIDDLQRMSIYDAKRLLQTSVFNSDRKILENGLTASLPRYGNKDAVMFRDAINFYEEQVLRQAAETDNLEQNLFALNKEAKYQIVSDNYSLFVDYFIDGSTECIWGNCTPSFKKLLNYSKRNSTYQHLRIRSNFIRMIGDYTTLSELENNPIKSLGRFVVKK